MKKNESQVENSLNEFLKQGKFSELENAEEAVEVVIKTIKERWDKDNPKEEFLDEDANILIKIHEDYWSEVYYNGFHRFQMTGISLFKFFVESMISKIGVPLIPPTYISVEDKYARMDDEILSRILQGWDFYRKGEKIFISKGDEEEEKRECYNCGRVVGELQLKYKVVYNEEAERWDIKWVCKNKEHCSFVKDNVKQVIEEVIKENKK